MRLHPTWRTSVLACVCVAMMGTGCDSSGGGGGDPGSGGSDSRADPGTDPGPGVDTNVPDPGPGADVPADLATPDGLSSFASPLEGAPCTPPTPALVITEVMVDPNSVADTYGEWFEVHNPGANAIDLKDWWLRSYGQTDHKVATSVVVPAGGYAVLCRNSNASLNGGVTNCAYQYTGLSLANSSDDWVEVADPAQTLVDGIAWVATSSKSAPVGRSVALRHPFLDHASVAFPTNPNDPASWAGLNFSPSLVQYGNGDYGTPGAKNTDVWQVVEAADCNDGEICTYDLCEAGACHHEWKSGCCHANADCNDGKYCTQDVCNIQNNTCSNNPVPNCCTQNSDCQDGNPCNYDYCFNYSCRFSSYNVVPGCCWAPANDPATGQPWNPPEKKQQYADAQCDDKNPCTSGDFCDLQTNVCQPGQQQSSCCLVNADCDDGNPCTYDSCWSNVCYHDAKPGCCVQNSDCDDGNACTNDVCTMSSCRHLVDPNTCCPSHAWCATYHEDGNPCTDEKCLYDPGLGIKACQHVYKPLCAVSCPYVETFDAATTFQTVGWSIHDFGTAAKNNWFLDDTGTLGPDKHVLFTWNPTTVLVKSVNVTPLVDCSVAEVDTWNTTKSSYLEWRMAYDHYQAGQNVTLRVVATAEGDYENGTVLWEQTTDQDIEYDIFHAALPAGLKFATQLQVGFLVETSSTVYLDSWRIDDVKVAAGVPNNLLKVQLWRCTDPTCSKLNVDPSTKVLEVLGAFPSLTMALTDHFRYQVCYRDVDGGGYHIFGFPHADLDTGGPLDKPGFVTPIPMNGQNSCSAHEHSVKAACGSGEAKFLCQLDLNPQNNEAYAGVYRVGIRAFDEWEVSNKPKHSPFESLSKADIVLLLPDGYLVWAPLGLTDPSALAIKAAIVASGRKAQIVTRLDTIPSLAPYDGIFVSLGVYGRYHALTDAEATLLKNYLDAGGRLYLEGGEFFYTGYPQPETVLHPYFKVTGTSDGASKLDGPLAGRNFVWGLDLAYSQNPLYNAWNDRIAHAAGEGGREVQHNAGTLKFATAVTFDSGSYRSIGSSVLFGGLQNAAGGDTPADLMAKYLYFLENGYPPCTQVEECEDFEVCTEDSCTGGACVNAAIPNCVPCDDDRQCGDDQACSVAKGYCVDIVCDGTTPCPVRAVAGAGQVPQNFGATPTTVAAKVAVTQPGLVRDVQVKAGAAHFYRGDVRLSLKAPDGTTVVLRQANPADAKQGIYETYDIGVPIAAGQTLDDFIGKVLVGDWQLVAEDTNPLIYNGQLQGFRFYASFDSPPCTVPNQCDDQNLCTTDECVSEYCFWTPKDCDDLDPCTLDGCDPATGVCTHQPVPGAGCGCARHADCPADEVCLADGLDSVCDPVSGPPDCHCRPICDSTVFGADCRTFPLSSGLPVLIPDADPAGVTKVRTVSGETGVVRKAWVKVVTNHTATGDLVAKLCRGATCAFLHYLSGGNDDGFYKVFEYDPSDGPGDMTLFKGRALNGDWTLTVSDNLGGDSGTWVVYSVYVLRTDCYQKADCDDANPCTVDDCQVNGDVGTCTHTAVQCQPTGNPCKVRECNPANGQCELKNQTDGTACQDGLYCTEDDSCQAGTCAGGPAKDCAYLNGNCLVGVCDEALDSCKPQTLTNGESCDAGEPCLEGDYCNANGNCQQGNVPACPCTSNADCVDDGNKCNGILGHCNLGTGFCELSQPEVDCYATNPPLPECKVYQCIPLTGACVEKNAPNFSPCEDGLFCTVGDYCESGACLPAVARDCSALNDKCLDGVCDEGSDACVAQPKAAGTACEREGNGCTIDKCDDAGVCKYDSDVDCSWMGEECNPSICQPLGWGSYECIHDPDPDGSPCSDDGNFCTDDTCLAGVCIHTVREHCQTCGTNADEPCPCGGQHSFDAGDNTCGTLDSCVGGINGAGQGLCYPTCGQPGNPAVPGTCVEAFSGVIDKPISEKNTPDTPNGCTTHKLTVSSAYQYVADALVKVEVIHTYLADLTVEVIDPQGYAHLIWNHLGFAEDNFYNTFDYSIPVPYPQILTSGVPMCSLNGEQLAGDWYIRVCDTGQGNGGFLHQWSLTFRGSNAPDLNPGHRCEDAINIGSIDINPAQPFSNTTECSVNIIPMSGCGSSPGPDRMFKFSLSVPKRVTITLPQPDRDLILYLKETVNGSCDPTGSVACSNSAGAGGPAEVIDRQILTAGTYYLGVDTNGNQYDYGPFQFAIRVRTLLADGENCVDPVLGPQDLDCLSGHCRNGYCCNPGPLGLNDCCPGGEWPVPPNGSDPNLIKADGDWISANGVCPAQYKDVPVCDPAPEPDQGDFLNACQGHRYDANCVAHVCTRTYVDDDVACDASVLSNRCGLYISEYCGDDGPFPPGAQTAPNCLTSCLQSGTTCTQHSDCGQSARCVNGKCENDSLCDAIAHCDVDPQNAQNSICLANLADGGVCNENSDCVSGHCQNGYCCQAGDCCPTNDPAGALKCPGSYTVAPSCVDGPGCEGERKDPVCVNYMCGQVLVLDDCSCAGTLANNCGLYIPVFCPAPWALSEPCSTNADCTSAPNGMCYDDDNPLTSNKFCVYADPDAPGGSCSQTPYPVTGGGQNVWQAPDPQCLTSCNNHGQGAENDALCDDVAHCDVCTEVNAHCTAADVAEGNAVCQADLPYGYPCNEDGDCKNYSSNELDGHCGPNGYCCLAGDCCAIDLGGSCDPQQYPNGCPNRYVCPTPNPPSGYWAASVCDDQTTCQGHRVEAVCNATFTCGTMDVPDDRGCTSDKVANVCGWYVSIYCNGQENQTPPTCPTTCSGDAGCDPNAHCDPPPALTGCDEPLCSPSGIGGCQAPGDNCIGGCGSGYVCVEMGATDVCVPPGECSPACSGGQVCADMGVLLLQPQCIYPDGMWSCKFDYAAHPPAADGAGTICQPRKPNDWACNEATDCRSGYCQVHFCCDVGGCCRGCRVTGWVPALGNGGTDDTSQSGVRAQSIWGQSTASGFMDGTPVCKTAGDACKFGPWNSSCPSGQVCVEMGPGQTDVCMPAGTCTPACSGGQVCANVGTGGDLGIYPTSVRPIQGPPDSPSGGGVSP